MSELTASVKKISYDHMVPQFGSMCIDSISDWRRRNLMKVNVAKSNYMIESERHLHNQTTDQWKNVGENTGY